MGEPKDVGLPARRTVSLYPGKELPVEKVRLLSAWDAQDVALPAFSSFLLFLPPAAVIIVTTLPADQMKS